VPSLSGFGSLCPVAVRTTSASAEAAVRTIAAWMNPNPFTPVFAIPPAMLTPYQGSRRLMITSEAPIVARRSWAASERNSSPGLERSLWAGGSPAFEAPSVSFGGPSVEGLPATVARVEVVPVLDRVLAELPAQIHLLAVANRRKVDQSAVDVADDDPRLLERAEKLAHLEERLAHLAPGRPAAVLGRGLGQRLVRVGADELLLRLAKLGQHRSHAREQRVRLLDRVVLLVDQGTAGARSTPRAAAHEPTGAVLAASRRARSRLASSSPISRSWPWNASC